MGPRVLLRDAVSAAQLPVAWLVVLIALFLKSSEQLKGALLPRA